MNLPKPTSTIQSTIKGYAIQVRRQLDQCQRLHPMAEKSELPELLVQDLLMRAPTLRPSTFRKYRAGVRLMFSSLKERPGIPPATAIALDRALARLESARPICRKQSDKTSAAKLKSCAEPDFRRVMEELKANPGKSKLAAPTATAAMLLARGGFRPGELWGLEMEQVSADEISVTVQNAKATNGRALGVSRQVRLKLLASEMSLALAWPGHVAVLAERYRPEKAMDRLARYFSDAGRRALNRHKVPSFYSLRHQATANMKAAGMSRAEIAAVLGHASDSTAGRHYARRVSGSGRSAVTADPSQVQLVRQTARAYGDALRQRPGMGI